jgi:hypothetical protein
VNVRRAARLVARAVLGLGMVATVAACGTTSTLPEGTLPPLQSGPFVPPSTVAPPTTMAEGATTVAGTQPPTTAAGVSGTSWGNWPYYEVPQLGTESVRGTGCGSTGGLGETLPDGVWNVLVGDGTGGDEFWTSSRITVDVRCVYSGVGGQQLWTAACTADPTSDSCQQQSADWYVVNANGRLRTMTVSPDVQYGVGALGASPCASVSGDRNSGDAPWRFMDSWITVDGGRVTAVVSACPAG